MDLFTKHVEPYGQVYERLGKVSRRSHSDCMKGAPSGFLDNIHTVARNIDRGSFKLNDKQFNILKKKRNLLSQACGNKRDSRKAFKSVRGGSLAKTIGQIVNSALKCPTQDHSMKAKGSSQATKTTSAQKRCRKSTES